MFRKFAVAALIAAFTFADTVAQACTGISLDAKDGAMIRGRTFEFGTWVLGNFASVDELKAALAQGAPSSSIRPRPASARAPRIISCATDRESRSSSSRSAAR
jgi:penicillin V acylase-like amidase (Ntn superfamily)